MKSMKILLAVIFCFFIAGIAHAIPQDVPDSRRVAQEFGGLEITSYEGTFYFTRGESVLDSDWNKYVKGEFKIIDDFVVYLKIDDVVIVEPGDEPLNGIPSNTEGRTLNFSLSLSAYEEISVQSKRPVAHGSFYTEVLMAGQPIKITLESGWILQDLVYTPIHGEDVDNLILVDENNIVKSFYDEYKEEFSLYMRPGEIINYRIMDGITRTVYEVGVVDLFGEEKDIKEENIVNVGLAAGVVVVDPKKIDGGINLTRQKLDGFVYSSIDENGQPAKVYIVKTRRRSGGIGIYGITGSIQIQEWRRFGQMETILEDTLEEEEYSYFKIEEGLNALVITITGENETGSDEKDEFDVYYTRY